MIKYKIGIDTGTKTGVAVWETAIGGGKSGFKVVTSMTITKAFEFIKNNYPPEETKLFIEDGRKWIGFAGKATAETNSKLQGAGSVKRDARIWQDWCIENGYLLRRKTIAEKALPPNRNDAVFVAPYHGKTMKGEKGDKDFRRITGWQGKTNEHARDAGMLVYGMG